MLSHNLIQAMSEDIQRVTHPGNQNSYQMKTRKDITTLGK